MKDAIKNDPLRKNDMKAAMKITKSIVKDDVPLSLRGNNLLIRS